MPFTFSHPAIILPLNCLPKKWFSLTGLIIGSLLPDFEYFIRMKIESIYSHTFWGIFYFNLPLGIALAFIFHNFVKTELFKNIPTALNQRFKKCEKLNWNKYFAENWIAVISSVIIGTISHIFWDSFTHESGYFAQNIKELTETTELFGREIRNLKILQHTSTFVGGLIIAYSIYKLPKTENIENKINLKYWMSVIIIMLVIITLRIEIGENTKQIGNIIVSLITAGMLGILTTPIILKNINGS